MSTSGVTIRELTRDEIIAAALRKLVVIGEGQTPNTDQLATGAEALNTVLLALQTLGLPLWKRTELTIPMIAGQNTYLIGVGQAINQPYPLKLQEAVYQYTGSSSFQDVEIKASYDWNMLPSFASGIPVAIKYQPLINYGELKVWPTPDTSAPGTMIITYQEPVDVVTAGTQTIDYPQEWQNAIIYSLVVVLSDEYGLPIPDKQWFERQADRHVSNAVAFGTEEASLFLYPNADGR